MILYAVRRIFRRGLNCKPSWHTLQMNPGRGADALPPFTFSTGMGQSASRSAGPAAAASSSAVPVVQNRALVDSETKYVDAAELEREATFMRSLVGSSKCADVTFRVGAGADAELIPAHRYVLRWLASITMRACHTRDWVFLTYCRILLAAKSPVFAVMLFSSFHESSSSRDDVIAVPDVNPAAFRLMLQAIYTGDCQLDDELLPLVLFCACKYQAACARLACMRFLQRKLSTYNACVFLKPGSMVLLVEERSIVLDFIETHFVDIVRNDPDFLSIDREAMRLLLQSDKLTADELDIFYGLIAWGRAECQRANVVPDAIDPNQVPTRVLLHMVFA